MGYDIDNEARIAGFFVFQGVIMALPATVWQPTSGNGEAGNQGVVLLTTEDDVVITTESSIPISLEYATFDQLASTIWTEDDGE